MSELEDIRRRHEGRSERQLAAKRRRFHEQLERLRKAKDRGGTLFEAIRPDPRRLRK